MTCPHADISLPTTSDPDTVCADCGEILQESSTAALTQTEKQSTLHPPAARCSRQTNQQGAMTMGTQKITVTVTNKDFGYAIKFLKKRGYTFNANEKTWSGTGDIAFLIDEAYVLELKN